VRTRVDGNHVTDNSVAFKVEQPGNLLIRNSAGGNGDAFGQVVQGNDVGPIGPAAQAQSPWSNILF